MIVPWYLFLLALLILISILAGQSSAPSGSTYGTNCKLCHADFAWYASLSPWKKMVYSAWYGGRKIACRIEGC